MVSVLMVGGLGSDASRHLIPHLLSPGTHTPSFVRIVDKVLAIPQADAYTTYVDTDCRAALKKGIEAGTVEYVQGNLLTNAMRNKAYTLPEAQGGPSKSFDWVFDLTGETDFSVPEVVHLERTLRLALLLGRSAVAHNVGVYVRALTPFYRLDGGDKQGKVGAEGSTAVPWGTMASWHHEAARGLAKMEGLNLVLVRPALFYGMYTLTGITPRALIAEVYKYQGEKLEFLWSESLALNTIHAADFAAALVSAATWALPLGRAGAIAACAERLPSTLSSDAQVNALADLGAAVRGDEVKATVFSACDDGVTTQRDIARVIEEVVGVKSGFHGSVISTFARLNIGEVVADVNEKHLEGWSELLQASSPPISSNVPISPSVPVDLLGPNPIAFDNSALKRLTGWAPRYRLDATVARETVEGFKREGHWPTARPKARK
ncbi:hypothetical protein JCM3770_005435 [Rhodotorula araucariae]